MNGTRGEVLARSILAKLDAHRQPSEETLRRLIGLIAETATGTNEEIDQGLIELEQDISSRYIASDTRQLEGFSLGACWGSLEVLRAYTEAASEFAALEQCVEVARRHRGLFETVHERPGITQGQLAGILGEKKSNFSQKLARLDKYQMLAISIVGRSKHLYLTRRGEDALKQASVGAEGQADHESMSNTIVRTIDAKEIVFGEDGIVDSHRHRRYISITRNENTGEVATANGNRRQHFRPSAQYMLESHTSSKTFEYLSNWKGHSKERFGRAIS